MKEPLRLLTTPRFSERGVFLLVRARAKRLMHINRDGMEASKSVYRDGCFPWVAIMC
ncbi:hypothetical protein PSAC2689_80141 [Paraburkholderia sacchari]